MYRNYRRSFRLNNIYSSTYPDPGGQANNWVAAYDLFDTSGDTINYTSGFHTYGLNWEPTSLTWYIDGVARRTVTTHIPPGSLSPGEMYLLVNLAIGGQFGGDPSGTTFPKALLVDYVRVYRNNQPYPTATPVVPTATVTPLPDGTTIIDFQSYTGPEAISGEYPAGSGVNWGMNQWLFSGPWELMTTNSIYFTSGATQRTVTFSTAKIPVSVTVYNGSDTTDSTVMLTCGGNPTVSRSIIHNALPVTISTGWTTACSTLTLSASTGQDTNFDNFTYR